MKAEVILSPGEYVHHSLRGATAVVIDVFRFTTTVLTALEAGLDRFYPVAEVEEAWALKEANPRVKLAGERQSLKIPGFDFGNSPLEHYGKSYSGGDLVCSTTNGTRAIQAAKGAEEVVLASLRSAEAVAAYLRRSAGEIVILPAGVDGKFSLEDTWCAGLILSELDVEELGDGAKTALLLWEQIDRSQLVQSAHGRRLQNLGLHADLEFCLEIDASPGLVLWDQFTGWGALSR